jgi:arabinogalactan oligomer/maltooligosaccharide transport system permease protein
MVIATPPSTEDTSHDRVPPDSTRTPLGVIVVKTVLLAVVDALGVFLVLAFARTGQNAGAVIAALILVAVNVTYFRKGGLPAKYLLPGLVFLLIFQLFVIVYTVYVSFTNYGSGHNIDKSEAVTQILTNSVDRVPGSAAYPVAVLSKGGTLYLLATAPDGTAKIGSADKHLEPANDATFDNGKAVSVPGYTTLTLPQLLAQQQAVTSLAVPVSADLNDGLLKTADARNAYVYRSQLVYSEQAGTMTDTKTGVVYTDNGKGNFANEKGKQLEPGWKAGVGLSNYATAFGASGDTQILGVIAWTFVFALLSVFLSFSFGTFLAITFNEPKMRGRQIYRVVMILPYAFPVFLSGLIWSGLLNTQFGYVNQVLLGGAQIPWLTDPLLARLSVVLVSVWFGFPYFFLVSTGALQAIPEDIQQAARVDGATAWQLFRRIKLPLLLVSTSPLLIAAFAFSFNDFNTIFMLTGGGPTDPTSQINAGATDILITVVYKLAFVGGSKDYGLASAFAVIIFVIVSTISIVLFRRTKSLEEVY